MKRFCSCSALCLLAGAALLPAPALADIGDINSLVVNARFFNDYPDSDLTIVNNYPSLLSITEQNFGSGGFANRHDALFSADGTNPYLLQTSEGFDLTVSAMLDAGSVAPRKEAGIRFNFMGFDGLFIITSDGESAAFGGVLPFHTFGGSAYTPGTVAEMRVIYTPDDDPDPGDGDASTIEYILNGTSSGPLNFGNLENGFIPNTQFGVFGQFQPDDSNPGDFALLEYSNFTLIPEPAAGLLLVIGGLGVMAGRRR